MNALPNSAPTDIAIGATFEGGFFAGLINIGGRPCALIVSPKESGEHAESVLLGSKQRAPEAISFEDGLTNTVHLAVAGSKLAKWARGLNINGFNDWYLPAADELELLYRAFKPTQRENWIYNRSGLNLSAIPPTRPYAKALPAQTVITAFQNGGAEAFMDDVYWSSTVLEDPDCAWYQGFYHGDQGNYYVYSKLRARAVRRSFL